MVTNAYAPSIPSRTETLACYDERTVFRKQVITFRSSEQCGRTILRRIVAPALAEYSPSRTAEPMLRVPRPRPSPLLYGLCLIYCASWLHMDLHPGGFSMFGCYLITARGNYIERLWLGGDSNNAILLRLYNKLEPPLTASFSMQMSGHISRACLRPFKVTQMSWAMSCQGEHICQQKPRQEIMGFQ